MRPSAMKFTALYIGECIRVAQFGGTEKHDVGFIEGYGGEGVGERGVVVLQMRRQSGDEERLGIVVEIGETGVKGKRIGGIEEVAADLHRLRGTRHFRLFPAASREKKEKKNDR